MLSKIGNEIGAATALPANPRVPEVSVVTSVYDGTPYLHKSIRSILGQEGVDFEFIIVDDGSDDPTARIIDAYANSHDSIRVIRQENRGLTEALICGCSAARGTLIARHDADDYSLPGRLAKQVAQFKKYPDVCMVSCWADMLGPRDEILTTITRPSTPVEATEALIHRRQGPPGHGSVVFRKEVYERAGGYRREFYYAQDSDLWLRMARLGSIAYVPEPLYQYHVTAESISGTLHHRKIPYANLVEDVRQAVIENRSDDRVVERARDLRLQQLPSPVKEYRDTTLYFVGKCLYDRGDRRCARYFWDALRVNPLKWKAAVYLGLSLAIVPKRARHTYSSSRVSPSDSADK